MTDRKLTDEYINGHNIDGQNVDEHNVDRQNVDRQNVYTLKCRMERRTPARNGHFRPCSVIELQVGQLQYPNIYEQNVDDQLKIRKVIRILIESISIYIYD